MAVAIDPSSPPLVYGGEPLTTASFSPPANSVLVAHVFIEDVTISDISTQVEITNTGVARTWTLRVSRQTSQINDGNFYGAVAIFTAPNPTAQSGITVTMSIPSLSAACGLKVQVVTGADLSSPIGTWGYGHFSANSGTPTVYTSTVANSLGLIAAQDWVDKGLPTSTDVEEAFTSGGLAGMAIVKAATTPTPGTGVTANMDAAGSTSTFWIWVAVEMRPTTAVNATATPAALAAATTIPAPSISTGRQVTPATLGVVVTTPAPTPSGGATPTPQPLAVVVSAPVPLIQTGGNVTIPAEAVGVVASVPAPVVAVDATTAPPALAVAASLPQAVVVLPTHATVAAGTLAVGVTILPPVVDTPTLPGSLIDADGQLEYGDPSSPFLMGTGTIYRISKISGWDSPASIENSNTRRQRRHGARSGPKRANQRIVNVEMTIESFSNPELVADRYAELELATPILEDAEEVPLVIRLYNGQTRLAYGAIIDRDMPDDEAYSVGAGKIGLLFACSDPVRYGIDARTAVLAPGETVNAVNAGNTKCRPQIRISGACVDPAIINVTTGRRLEFGVALDADEWIDVDCNLGYARFNGEVSVLAGISAASVPSPDAYWLAPGSNQLTFECASSGPGARLDYVFRDSYL